MALTKTANFGFLIILVLFKILVGYLIYSAFDLIFKDWSDTLFIIFFVFGFHQFTDFLFSIFYSILEFLFVKLASFVKRFYQKRKTLIYLDANKNKIKFEKDNGLWNSDVLVIIFFFVNKNRIFFQNKSKLKSGDLQIYNWQSFLDLCFNNPDIIFLIETDKNDVGFEKFSN